MADTDALCVYNIRMKNSAHVKEFHPLEVLSIPYIQEMGLQQTKGQDPLPFHTNAGFEFVYTYSGRYRWELEDRRILEVPGHHFSLTHPETRHRGYLDHMMPGKLLYIVFDPYDPSFLAGDTLSHAEREHCIRTLENSCNSSFRASDRVDDQALGLWQLFEEVDQQDVLFRAMATSQIELLLLAMLHQVSQGRVQERLPVLQPLLDHIDTQLGERLDTAYLSMKSGWSVSQLYTLFARATGQSPNDYIQSRRCERAADLLRDTDQSVTEIAIALGFSSSQYFCRVFRKYTGLQPGRFRKMSRERDS